MTEYGCKVKRQILSIIIYALVYMLLSNYYMQYNITACCVLYLMIITIIYKDIINGHQRYNGTFFRLTFGRLNYKNFS